MLQGTNAVSLAAAIHANASRALLPRRRLLQAGALFASAAVTPLLLQADPADADPSHHPAGADGPADWLFGRGGVYTMNPARQWAEAVAVRGKRIMYVGDASGAAHWHGPHIRLVDLKGRMLLPCFVDAHDHFATLGTGAGWCECQLARHEQNQVLRT